MKILGVQVIRDSRITALEADVEGLALRVDDVVDRLVEVESRLRALSNDVRELKLKVPK